MPTTYTVQQGDTVIRLAELHGLASETIWDDPANKDLRELRGDMNILMPGDILIIPDIQPRLEKRPTGAVHVFQTVTTPAIFRLQIFDMHNPRANQNYSLAVDTADEELYGTTDKDGILEEYVSPKASAGIIVIGPDKQKIVVNFGHLNPLSELSGVQQRLRNLGYDPGPPSDAVNAALKAALRSFQWDHKLTVNGELTEATLKKLAAVHDAPYKYPEPV